jgi:hypothetical protein
VPDVERGALDRLAGLRVDERDPQVQRDALAVLGDVAADLLEGDVVGPLLLLGRERAGGDGVVGLEQRRALRAAERPDGLAAGELHGDSIVAVPGRPLGASRETSGA